MEHNWIDVRWQETLKKSVSVDDSLMSESKRMEAFRSEGMIKWIEQLKRERGRRKEEMKQARIEWTGDEMLFIPGRRGTGKPLKIIKLDYAVDFMDALDEMIDFGRQKGFDVDYKLCFLRRDENG